MASSTMVRKPITTADMEWIGNMLGKTNSHDCQKKYPDVNDPTPTFTTVVLTIAIIVLTIIIEVSSMHGKNQPDPPAPTTTPPPPPPPPTSTSTSTSDSTGNDGATAEQAGVRVTDSIPGKGPHVPPTLERRATRFVTTTILLAILCVCVVFRIKEMYPHISELCRPYLKIAPHNWWVITIFNIVPVICAFVAWLRTIVDCVLVRWNKSLSVDQWPAVLPLIGVFMVVAGIGAGIYMGFYIAVLWAMGGKVNVNKENEVEMGAQPEENINEEERGLMQDVDGEASAAKDEDDEVTVYSPRESLDRKESPPPYSGPA